MDILTYNGYEGTAEVDVSRGVCHGRILCISDLVTFESDSPSGLQREFELAVDDYLATCEMLGKEPQKPYKGTFNVRVSPATHKGAVIRAACDDISLNELVSRALTAYLAVSTEIKHHHDHNIKLIVEANSPVRRVPISVSQNMGTYTNNFEWMRENAH